MLAKVKGNTLLTYPYDFSALQADNPYTRFGSGDVEALFDATEAHGRGERLVEVEPPEVPQYDPETEILVEGTPIFAQGKWRRVLSVQSKPPPTTDQIIATAKEALAESDSVLLRVLETEPSVPQEWAEYRAALRAVIADPTQPLPVRPADPA